MAEFYGAFFMYLFIVTPNLHATKLEVYHTEMQGGGLIDCCKINKGYQDSLVVIATKLWTGRQRTHGSSWDRDRNFSLFYIVQTHPASYPVT